MKINASEKRIRPEWIAIKAFSLAILAGTILLILPFSSHDGNWTDPLTALFTATSATCVTGLIVVDTGSYFSFFGQLVILCLIQLGGIGIMTLGTFLLVLVGRRLSMRNDFVLTDALGREHVRGVKSFIVRACLFALLIESAGVAVLAHRLVSRHGYSYTEGAYYGVFHAISAFCNAGFSLYQNSLVDLRSDKVIILSVAALIILGGLGFLVLYNLSSIKFWRRNPLLRGNVTLHSKIVLTGTLFLVIVGWVIFTLVEWNQTLAPLDWSTKLSCAFFQSVTPRTAGFNVIDMSQTRPATLFSTIILMFIGGSPGSAAGGIKTTTLIVLILTVCAMIRGRDETELYHKSVPVKVVREAISIFVLSLLCVGLCFAALLLTQHLPSLSADISASDALMFETVSAFATVGLSTGISPQLSIVGKLCIVACMFIGRLGSLTIALVVGRRELGQAVRYPDEEVVVG